MYNQGNMRLHVDIFIKYYQIMFILTTTMASQSILNIFLTFFNSLYFMTTLCGLFSVWYWYHWFFLPRRERWAEREMGNTQKNTATLTHWPIKYVIWSWWPTRPFCFLIKGCPLIRVPLGLDEDRFHCNM